jgi:hypothetical protein
VPPSRIASHPVRASSSRDADLGYFAGIRVRHQRLVFSMARWLFGSHSAAEPRMEGHMRLRSEYGGGRKAERTSLAQDGRMAGPHQGIARPNAGSEVFRPSHFSALDTSLSDLLELSTGQS